MNVRNGEVLLHFSRAAPENWRSAPLLGEDNAHVFKTILGIPSDEFDELSDEGII